MHNEDVVKQIEQFIQLYFAENNTICVTPQVLWDAAKPVLRGQLIALASSIQKRNNIKKKTLIQNISKLEKLHNDTNSTKIFCKLLSERKT